MIERVELKSRGGWRIVGMLHIPGGRGPFPGIVICHGFTSSKDKSTQVSMAEDLSRAGFAALRIDLYGSGESAGKLEDMTVTKQVKDLLGALDFMEKHPSVDGKRLGVVGSSLGGMVAGLGTAKDRRVKSLVLRCPVSDMKGVVNNVFSKVSKKSGLDYSEFIEDGGDNTMKIKYRFYTNATEQPLYKVAGKIRCPVLIVHGTSDSVVPISQSVRLVGMLGKPSRLKKLFRADHSFNDSQYRKMREETVKWFRAYLGVEK